MAKGNRRIPQETKDAYLAWLLTPPSEREPATKDAMADELGVSVPTLYNWENTPKFQEELRQLKFKWGAKFQGEILGRLIEIVQKGTDTAAIQAAKVLLPHLDTGPKEVREEDLTDDRLAKIKAALRDEGFEVLG